MEHSTARIAMIGVCSAGLASTALPAASAAAIWPVKIASGKFHGLMQVQMPRGAAPPWLGPRSSAGNQPLRAIRRRRRASLCLLRGRGWQISRRRWPRKRLRRAFRGCGARVERRLPKRVAASMRWRYLSRWLGCTRPTISPSLAGLRWRCCFDFAYFCSATSKECAR